MAVVNLLWYKLPESCEENSEAFKEGFKTIADIGKERIRRVIKKIENEQTEKVSEAVNSLPGMDEKPAEMDLGFKVFKLDSTNIKPWEADFESFDEEQLEAFVENIKEDRSEDDILYEILLKYGLDLTLPIEERTIDGCKIYIVGMGALVVCLSDKITLNAVEGIAQLKEEIQPELMRVVFKDNGFKDDVVKTNAVQILRLKGIDDIKFL